MPIRRIVLTDAAARDNATATYPAAPASTSDSSLSRNVGSYRSSTCLQFQRPEERTRSRSQPWPSQAFEGRVLNIAPRQTVNQVCRRLADRAVLRREVGPSGKEGGSQ